MSAFQESNYFRELKNNDDRKRYEEKMQLLGCIEDPYCRMERKGGCRSSSVDWMDWPSVSYPDIYNYLIHTPSEYTHEMLQAHKSTDGYNFLMNGWVNNILVTKPEGRDHYIFTATVKHSQTLSAPPLKTWVACKSNGLVIVAHCTCMAGTGEVCSHIAAILFAADANTQVKQQQSCTSLPCSWLPPSFRTVEYLPVSEIDFTTPKQKRKIGLPSAPSSAPATKKVCAVSTPTELELNDHFTKLSKTKLRPLLLSLESNFNNDFVPLYARGLLPEPLTSLYSQEYEDKPFGEIAEACGGLYSTVSITLEQARMVELKTRDQAQCKLWYEQRAGRVTASKLRKVLHTSYSKPSVSLLKSVCYPQSMKFNSRACEYGRQHEDDALRMYSIGMQNNHNCFELKKSGLILDPNNPFIGASPDGVFSCSCCGKGVVEVKCPFSCKDKSFCEAVKDKTFCLQEDFRLKPDHDYLYQVQMQMKLCGVKLCDFIVWGKDGILQQRIEFNEEFIETALLQAKSFVKLCVLPELLSRCFSRGKKQTVESDAVDSDEEPTSDAEQPSSSMQAATSSEDDEENGLWCYCQRDGHYDRMIACDGDNCPIEWFHLSCMDLTEDAVPEGDWYCPDCGDQQGI